MLVVRCSPLSGSLLAFTTLLKVSSNPQFLCLCLSPQTFAASSQGQSNLFVCHLSGLITQSTVSDRALGGAGALLLSENKLGVGLFFFSWTRGTPQLMSQNITLALLEILVWRLMELAGNLEFLSPVFQNRGDAQPLFQCSQWEVWAYSTQTGLCLCFLHIGKNADRIW